MPRLMVYKERDCVEIQPAENQRIFLRGPFIALVLVLLAAMGISVVAGLKGLSRLDVTVNHMVGQDAQRLLMITHIRRLFRTELILAHEQNDLEPGEEREKLKQRTQEIRKERTSRLEQLRALQVPGSEVELRRLEELHDRLAIPSGDSHAWESLIATLLVRVEQRFTDRVQEAHHEVAAARRLLLGASAAALLAALGLGSLVLWRVGQAGHKLARNEEQLRRVIESAPSLLVMLSSARKPIFIPPRAPSIMGHSLQALANDFFIWVKADERAAIEAKFDDCLHSGKTVENLTAHAVRNDGSEWDAWLSMSLLATRRDPEILMQILDITAQRKAEAESRILEVQLRQAQKMESIGMLAGGVAHDFNNLLTAIKGYSSLLAEESKQDELSKEAIDGIIGAADRAAVLTRKLLSFSRKQIIEPRPQKLDEVVKGMEPILRRILGEDVQLQVRTTSEKHTCMIDASQVEQIIMNLAVNARQAMPKGGLLMIETSNVVLNADYHRSHPEVSPGPYVQLMVSDTGIGMTSEVQQRAFEPFFTTKPVGQGTGLGLSVVYGAIRQQGGHITLYSEPNVGTTFRIYWPATELLVDQTMPTPTPVTHPMGHEVILLVEDDSLVRSFSQRALREQGYQVIDTENAEAALELFKTLTPLPALLITDVILPGLHGPALAEVLRQQIPNLPVLFCSGYSEQLMSETGHLAPGASLLQKPYDAHTLVSRVKEILSKKNTRKIH